MRQLRQHIRFYGLRQSHHPDKFNCLISQQRIEPKLLTSNESGKAQSSPSLSNLTYACKDNIVTRNTNSTAASHALYNYKSPFDATVVELLSREGATCIGKANLDEFGMGSANRNSYYGDVFNPFRPGTVPGGSLGGSAAAVCIPNAKEKSNSEKEVGVGGEVGEVGKALSDFALGTDTGGSVRLPAAYCDVIGFKPTYGRISRWGVIPYAQTLDTVGILARKVDIVQRVYDVINRFDEKDPTSLPVEVRSKIQSVSDGQDESRKFVIGVPEQFVMRELSDTVREKWSEALDKFASLGHKVISINLRSICKALPAYYTIATSEAASNLARYDGTRYGYTAETPENHEQDLMRLIFQNRTESLGKEVQRRIILGNYTLSSESAAYYMMANEVREKLAQDFSSFFTNEHPLLRDASKKKPSEQLCDLMVCPTAMGVAPTVEEYLSQDKESILNGYVNDVFTVPASLVGIPTISMPFDGVGIQLMGQFGDDALVLQAAKLLEQN